MSSERRVVITGMGVIGPLGNTLEGLWDALIGGRSGVRCLDPSRSAPLPVPLAAEAVEFTGDIDNFGTLDKEQKKSIRKGLKMMCRECQMGVAAAQRALSDARLPQSHYDPERIGVSFGSDYMLTEAEEFTESVNQCVSEQGQFQFGAWAPRGLPKMQPLWLLKYLPNMPASHVAIYNDLRGPSNSLTLREAVGNVAVAEASQIIAHGKADCMVVGATGTRVHPMKAVHTIQLEETVRTTNGDPTTASRPFELRRSGMVLGEGSGVIVIEELQRALARGATIYAEVLGGASSAALGSRLKARRAVAMRNAMRATLRAARETPAGVGHIQAHGLGTRSSDEEEASAIGDVFGSANPAIPVTAVKSYTGNLGAGSGVVELIAGVLALTKGTLFRTLNHDTPDPACPINVVKESMPLPGNSFLCLSTTPLGQASSAMVRAFEG